MSGGGWVCDCYLNIFCMWYPSHVSSFMEPNKFLRTVYNWVFFKVVVAKEACFPHHQHPPLLFRYVEYSFSPGLILLRLSGEYPSGFNISERP